MSKNTHEMDATGGLKGFLARRREGLMHGVFAWRPARRSSASS